MNLKMFSPLIMASNSSFHRILHNSFSFTGPYIFRKIFLPNTASALSSSMVSVQYIYETKIRGHWWKYTDNRRSKQQHVTVTYTISFSTSIMRLIKQKICITHIMRITHTEIHSTCINSVIIQYLHNMHTTAVSSLYQRLFWTRTHGTPFVGRAV